MSSVTAPVATPKARPYTLCQCKACGEMYIGRAQSRYCSNPDCTIPRRSNRGKPNQNKTCSECGKNGVVAHGLCSSHYSKWRRAQGLRSDKVHTKSCEFCGQLFRTTTKRVKHCSSTCGVRNIAGWSKSKDVALRAKPKRLPQPVVHKRTTNRLTCGSCRVCGASFVSFNMDVTCSDECREIRNRQVKVLHKAKRRALKRNAFVAPVYRKKVFEADGYRCHICGKMTSRNAVVPHPKAPTIDHLIPLAQGGMHEPSNCRTAHFLCNALKGDRSAHDQLILFAM